MLTKWKLLAVLAVAASVLAAPLKRVSAQADYCTYHITFKNDKRRVPGAVNKECGGVHSPPWGNWGVDSNYTSRQDGYQFAGWHPLDGWRQWNSCTRDYNYPAYLNDNGRGQRAYPDIPHNYSTTSWGPSGTCPNVVTFSGSYMKIWELDKRAGDDEVGVLGYPAFSAPLTCRNPFTCSGQSAWVAPNLGPTSIVTAKIKAHVSKIGYVKRR